MDDPLWRHLDISQNCIQREQLELVIQKKKINEVYNWFHEHFVACSKSQYLNKCPLVIIQGPTGCGKTTTLKWISNKLKIPIREYSETTDTTAINYDLNEALKSKDDNDRKQSLTQSIDRRKTLKFEHFVINSIKYNPLYSTDDGGFNEPLIDEAIAADSEFDYEDEDEFLLSLPCKPPPPPPVSGVIIHIETPLSFAKSQRILIQSLCRLLKLIKDLSRTTPRRVAIVFETLEGDSETLSLPSKFKNSLNLQLFKFNAIIRTNMKKLIESLMKNFHNIILEKETIEQIITDSDGDIRACINTLQLICHRSSISVSLHKFTNNGNQQRYNINTMLSINSKHDNALGYDSSPASKKQKVNHEKIRLVKLIPSLMRDNSRNLGFFHVLGKIFYQKRLYPLPDSIDARKLAQFNRSIDRPYATENSTEYLTSMLDTEPKNLIAWLHQHYHKFCSDSNIEKAALFLENQCIVDTTSLNSTQSSQFYEMHNSIDQLQAYLAIESTVYSLYEDQSKVSKTSHKKILHQDLGHRIIKSSVESSTMAANGNGDLKSFNKPAGMSLSKVVQDYQTILDICSAQLIKNSSTYHPDSSKILTDYIPYLKEMSNNWRHMSPNARLRNYGLANGSHSLFDNGNLNTTIEALSSLNYNKDSDFDSRHEHLLELIDMVEERDIKQFC